MLRDGGVKWHVHTSLETLPCSDLNCSQETLEFHPCERLGKS